MEAGRELDAVVAERVMGLHKLPKSKARDISPARAGNFKPSSYYGPLYRDKDGTTLILPAYSTDIAAAWAVVERLKPYFAIKIERPVMCPGLWEVEFRYDHPADETIPWLKGVPDIDSHVEGTNLPHAICLAALKAVGA